MSRIYVVTDRGLKSAVRWVRANTLAGALRAVAEELFEVHAASSDEVYRAMSTGVKVLDAAPSADEAAEPAVDTPPLRAVS
jgi:hypothetical protein